MIFGIIILHLNSSITIVLNFQTDATTPAKDKNNIAEELEYVTRKLLISPPD